MDDLNALADHCRIPSGSIFTARHYEFLAALAAQVYADYGDYNMARWLCQAFCQTQANFKPVLWNKRIDGLAKERKVKANG
jgi:hypothetical protein